MGFPGTHGNPLVPSLIEQDKKLLEDSKGKKVIQGPEDEFERVICMEIYGDLKVMFEPDIKSDIWRMLQGYRVTIWKLIDSSGVHFVRLQVFKDNTRKQGNKEDTSKSMLAINGVGIDWSDMVEEQVQTNMALMAFSDSECDDLLVKLNQSEFIAATYKRGLETVEEQLITYRKNGVLFCEEVAVLKREVPCKDYEINMLK
ncbi:hypothetical protein Tco_0633376, partial [Tanacetum coccineum]